ncbi:uncharacterized protein LOC110978040 isoform X1 [Acanthaster planci]|uniref:Uncharacterized protein LOC110978040 isoform X1 n=2 Tax=Acanthaster planci TaxID=133434 RepID=A0A8B7Y591_ACAPL|nr:uncharacterized protein LOC110978040 isoform X1 [Acanthaster planci]
MSVFIRIGYFLNQISPCTSSNNIPVNLVCRAFRSSFPQNTADGKQNLGTNTTARPPPQVELPDYNTSVNVHEHRLKRPEKPPPLRKKWVGLDELKQRTKGSLIPETLKEMEQNEDFQITAANLRKMGQAKLTREERKKRQRALDNLGVPNFREFITKWSKQPGHEQLMKQLKKVEIGVLQLNIGLYCNQACNHCHVESSPKRTETMTRQTAERCLEILKNSPTVHTLDLTGGAPELAGEFKFLARGGRDLGREVIDRCNLTALLEPGQEDTAEFLAKNKITVIASLPCYSAKNVNTQRGSGVFDKSIQALLLLNQLGYGKPDRGLRLDLVYNPLGGFLPPSQSELEAKYKEELWDTFGIEFNSLYTITNMPIKRFADFLYRRNELEDYMQLLVRNFNPASVEGLMCRNHLNVNWDGRLFDCDFNQQLDMGMRRVNSKMEAAHDMSERSSSAPSVWDIESTDDLVGLRIVTDNHCFGCTSGMGSSCQGTTA